MLYIKIKLQHLCLKNRYNLNPSYCCVSLITMQIQNSTFHLDQLLNTREPADIQ